MRRPAIAAAIVFLMPWVAAQEPPPMLVATATVTEGQVREQVGLLGTVRPVMDSLVACEVDGRVDERRVENGDFVARGATLVRLDATRLEKQLDHAESEKAEVDALLELAQIQEKRAQELYRDDVLSVGDLDEALSRRQSLEGRTRAIETRIAAIRDDIARTIVRAPFGGIVTEVRTEVGEWIRQGDAVVRLSKLERVEIQVDVPERYFPRLEKGAAVPVTIEALPGLVLAGTIFALVPRADREARTFPVLIRADNPDGRVAAGMLAQVELTLGAGQLALLVPKDAIVRQGQSEVVYIVVDDVARIVPVKSGRASGDRVEVTGELTPGQSVVVRGNERLAPGQHVRVDGTGD
jgi:RND family efflux transporter MFP subunit